MISFYSTRGITMEKSIREILCRENADAVFVQKGDCVELYCDEFEDKPIIIPSRKVVVE